jgi:LysM repeat protein
MRRTLSLLTACLLLGMRTATAQSETREQTTPLLTARDSLLLTVVNGRKLVQHPVKPKQTLFSIARFYSLSLEELYEHNPGLRTDPNLKIGDRIRVPLPNLAIKRYKTKKFVASKNTPIYYIVQNGDNLYQICKRHFDMPVDSIVKRNGLKNNNIRPGQTLLVAWMGTEGVLPEWRPKKDYARSDALKGRYEQEKIKRKEVDSQGVCFWQKESKEKGDLYALHREAAIGTVICITNPMGGRSVYAKVIGRIPDGYERNIEVVLSPEAARKIGARDPKFFVRVKFLKWILLRRFSEWAGLRAMRIGTHFRTFFDVNY